MHAWRKYTVLYRTPRHHRFHCHYNIWALISSMGQSQASSHPWNLTPLHSAIRLGRLGIVSQLIYAGADKEAKDESGFTPLERAAKDGHYHIAELLVRSGSSINFTEDSSGHALCRPVELAVAGGHYHVAEMLTQEVPSSPYIWDLIRRSGRRDLMAPSESINVSLTFWCYVYANDCTCQRVTCAYINVCVHENTNDIACLRVVPFSHGSCPPPLTGTVGGTVKRD